MHFQKRNEEDFVHYSIRKLSTKKSYLLKEGDVCSLKALLAKACLKYTMLTEKALSKYFLFQEKIGGLAISTSFINQDRPIIIQAIEDSEF